VPPFQCLCSNRSRGNTSLGCSRVQPTYVTGCLGQIDVFGSVMFTSKVRLFPSSDFTVTHVKAHRFLFPRSFGNKFHKRRKRLPCSSLWLEDMEQNLLGEENWEYSECVICLEEIEDGRFVGTKSQLQTLYCCKQIFHKKCLTTWRIKARKTRCPHCRREIKEAKDKISVVEDGPRMPVFHSFSQRGKAELVLRLSDVWGSRLFYSTHQGKVFGEKDGKWRTCYGLEKPTQSRLRTLSPIVD